MIKSFSYFILLALLTSACVEKELNESTQSTQDFNQVFLAQHNALLSINQLISHQQNKQQGNFISYGSCGTVLLDSGYTDSTFSRIGSLSFTKNCSDEEGNVRSGKILFEVTAPINKSGARYNISFDSFSYNGLLLAGSINMRVVKVENSEDLKFTYTFKDFTASTSDEILMTWQPKMEYLWTKGFETISPLDDHYEVTGEVNGSNSNGRKYNVIITDALQIKNSCNAITQGKMQLVPQYLSERIVNFGIGACDQSIEVQIDDVTKTVTLE